MSYLDGQFQYLLFSVFHLHMQIAHLAKVRSESGINRWKNINVLHINTQTLIHLVFRILKRRLYRGFSLISGYCMNHKP